MVFYELHLIHKRTHQKWVIFLLLNIKLVSIMTVIRMISNKSMNYPFIAMIQVLNTVTHLQEYMFLK